MGDNPPAEDDRPVVFTFTFGNDWYQSQFQSLHSRLLNNLFERCTLRHAKTAQQALALFTENDSPRAVFVADSAIMNSRNEVVSQRLVQYVTDGGIVIFGGTFSNIVDHEKLDVFFGRTWDVPWEAGSQQRTTLSLNLAAVNPSLRNKLPASYSQKALFLQGVERHESWYLPTTESVIESYAPLPGPVADLTETPVVFASFGDGHIGYIGDLSAEEGTDAAVLAMMGLL
ncbi:hypothetical protein PT974_01217 [Cladobotryum mycophilum]|uniref:Uncharacterized protein n=1 Tax=Cladobotryum mycophilum TaxID=491253 RepID=A0ABR0T337_9HYPO